jgi:hypothetical protein
MEMFSVVEMRVTELFLRDLCRVPQIVQEPVAVAILQGTSASARTSDTVLR